MIGISNISTYKLISNYVTVKDIADAIAFRIPSDMSVEDAYCKLAVEMYVWQPYYLVVDGDEVLGYLSYHDDVYYEPHDEEIGRRVKPITPGMIISSTTPVMELPKLLMRQPIYFLLSGSVISHILRFEHLDRLPMKLSLFSRFLELEEAIVDHLRWMVGTGELTLAMKRLSPRHLQAIHTTCVQDTGEDSDNASILLDYTSFADRKELVKRFPKTMDNLPFESRSDYDHFFFNVQKLRNRIAHSGRIRDLFESPEELSDFITDLDNSIGAFHELNNWLYDKAAPSDFF